MDRIFGGRPLAVLVRLAVVSIIVGIVLMALDLRPRELFAGLGRIVRNVWAMGFDAFGWLGNALILGAMVVLPIWGISRLIGVLVRRDRHGEGDAGRR